MKSLKVVQSSCCSDSPTSTPISDDFTTHDCLSVCSTCLREVPAILFRKGADIWMRKQCSEHGEEVVLDSRGTGFYHISPLKLELSDIPPLRGEPLGPTCVGLIEITDACNLECPVCFAASGPDRHYQISMSEFEDRINSLCEKKGKIDIVMLSGGEPTVHREFEKILHKATHDSRIGRVLLNTNGVLLSREHPVRDAVLKNREKLEIYLQFDSLKNSTNVELRGKENLVSLKRSSYDWLNVSRIPTTLAVTLRKSQTREELREIILVAFEHARGITFQPAFSSGRHDLDFDPNDRLTTPEVISRICSACPEHFTEKAFTNLPCSHPNCAIVSYFYRAAGKLWPLCEDLAPSESLKNRINYSLDDLRQCGCETTDLGNYIRSAELSADNSFRVVIKPFMDRYNLNRDRTAQCCTHVVGPKGQTMSFCEYNVFRNSLNWNS